MTARANGIEIVDCWWAWGVRYTGEDGELYVLECDDEGDAANHQMMFGGEVVRAKVMCTEWTVKTKKRKKHART